jgi:hypothetical protein
METVKNSSQSWEDEKIEMKRKLFTHVETFLKFDAKANEVLLDFINIIKNNFEKDPSSFKSDTNLRELLRELKSKKCNCDDKQNDLTGNDIAGEFSIGDIIDFIKSIGIDLISKEKDFFMEIIRLIFCGC